MRTFSKVIGAVGYSNSLVQVLTLAACPSFRISITLLLVLIPLYNPSSTESDIYTYW